MRAPDALDMLCDVLPKSRVADFAYGVILHFGKACLSFSIALGVTLGHARLSDSNCVRPARGASPASETPSEMTMSVVRHAYSCHSETSHDAIR